MAKSRQAGSVRIIAGSWRGRRLPVPDVAGLRPSGDRGRETLFNWLQPYLAGARVADLFAGTGVLGLEAVSRGAECAVLVEKSARAAASLAASVTMLKAGDRVSVAREDALAWLAAQPPGRIDLAFVDPPFDAGLAQLTLDALAAGGVLAGGARVYVETGLAEKPPRLPPGWSLLRERALGEVRMQLLELGGDRL